MDPDPQNQYRIDLHVHTSRYSPCAETLNTDLLAYALEKFNLDGLVITDHNRLWSSEEIAAINLDLSAGRIYRGVELSCREGHFILIGLKSLDGFRPGMHLQEFLAPPRDPRVAVIWAHPYAYGPPSLSLAFDDRMRKIVDAVEVVSSVSQKEACLRSHEFADAYKWRKVAGSDAHAFDSIGFAHTVFPQLPPDETALAHFIKVGPVWPRWQDQSENTVC